MQREVALSAFNWCDKTMTVLKENQIEICEKHMDAQPAKGLFDEDCSACDSQTYWDTSFFREERGAVTQLYSCDEMRQIVLAQLEREYQLLSVSEQELMEQMLILDEEIELFDIEALVASQALVKRLWCVMRKEDNRFFVRLPRRLKDVLLERLDHRRIEAGREKLFSFDATVHGLLYVAGYLHASELVTLFLNEVAGQSDALSSLLAKRYLCAAFDYTFDDTGRMILLHPGLAEPETLLKAIHGTAPREVVVDEGQLLGGMQGLFEEERALYEMMVGELTGALRPEYSQMEAATDLRLLAKQGVSYDEIANVLASMLVSLPTERMLQLLKRMSVETPQWGSLNMKLRH